MKKIWLTTILTLVACTKVAPVRLFVATDCSGSAFSDDFRNVANATLLQAADILVANYDHLTLKRFGATIETLWDNPRPDPLRPLGDTIAMYLSEACEGRGSRITETLESTPSDARGVVMFTDGVLADDPVSERFVEVAKQLAEAPNIAVVWVAGVRVEGEWRDDMLPKLQALQDSGKLITSSLNETNEAFELFRRKLGR
jgi:hypothetical protein